MLRGIQQVTVTMGHFLEKQVICEAVNSRKLSFKNRYKISRNKEGIVSVATDKFVNRCWFALKSRNDTSGRAC